MSDTSRTIPDTGFAGDTGEGDPALLAALERFAAEPGRAPEVVAALAPARVLVAVVAVLTEEQEPVDGLRREKSTDMALVTVQRPDGRRAVPAFTSLETLAAWRADARPVPVEASRAALSAAAEGAVALLLDPAGPVPFVVSGPALRAVAEGSVPPPMYADAELLLRVRVLAVAVPGVLGARLEPAPDVDARLVLTLEAGADVAAAMAALGPALQSDELLRARTISGLDVAVQQG